MFVTAALAQSRRRRGPRRGRDPAGSADPVRADPAAGRDLLAADLPSAAEARQGAAGHAVVDFAWRHCRHHRRHRRQGHQGRRRRGPRGRDLAGRPRQARARHDLGRASTRPIRSTTTSLPDPASKDDTRVCCNSRPSAPRSFSSSPCWVSPLPSRISFPKTPPRPGRAGCRINGMTLGLDLQGGSYLLLQVGAIRPLRQPHSARPSP